MTRCPPYRPFRGAEPPHFVDRAEDDDIGEEMISRAALSAYALGPADPRFHRLVFSAPGLGKTALLRSISRSVGAELGWAVAWHRCRPKERALARLAAEVLQASRDRWGGPAAWPRWVLAAPASHPGARPALRPPAGSPGTRPALPPPAGSPAARPALPPPTGSPGTRPALRPPAGSPGTRRAVPPPPGPTAAGQPATRQAGPAPVPSFVPPGAELPWSELRGCLGAVGELAGEHGGGVLLALDDIDLLCPGEAECLGHLARAMSRAALPVAFLMSAGEPLAGHFARRGHYWGTVWPTRLSRFDDVEAREALVVPAAEREVEFQESAIALACSLAEGAPLHIQQVGFAAWSRSRRGRVTVADVKAAGRDLAGELARTG